MSSMFAGYPPGAELSGPWCSSLDSFHSLIFIGMIEFCGTENAECMWEDLGDALERFNRSAHRAWQVDDQRLIGRAGNSARKISAWVFLPTTRSHQFNKPGMRSINYGLCCFRCDIPRSEPGAAGCQDEMNTLGWVHPFGELADDFVGLIGDTRTS